MFLPDDAFPKISLRIVSCACQPALHPHLARRRTEECLRMENGFDNLHALPPLLRSSSGNLPATASPTRETTFPPPPHPLAGAMHMTQQETIKISNNLTAVMFLLVPVRWRCSDGALFREYSNTKPLPSLIFPVLSCAARSQTEHKRFLWRLRIP